MCFLDNAQPLPSPPMSVSFECNHQNTTAWSEWRPTGTTANYPCRFDYQLPRNLWICDLDPSLGASEAASCRKLDVAIYCMDSWLTRVEVLHWWEHHGEQRGGGGRPPWPRKTRITWTKRRPPKASQSPVSFFIPTLSRHLRYPLPPFNGNPKPQSRQLGGQRPS